MSNTGVWSDPRVSGAAAARPPRSGSWGEGVGEAAAEFTTLLRSAPRPGAASPLDLALSASTPGVIEARPSSRHILALHVGGPVRTTCDRLGRMEPRVQVEGEIDIRPAGETGLWIDESPALTFFMRLSPDHLDRVARETGWRAGLPSGPIRDPGLEQLAWALKSELETGEASGRIYMDGLTLALCARLTARFGAPAAPVSARTGPALSARRLEQVKDYIEANLDQGLPLASIAGAAGSSPSHFKVLFRRAAGIPLHQYVIRRRVERARELLQATDLPITEVALEVGFAHQSHLARWTRRLLGVSPSELAGRDGAGRARRR
jgi:AraC family transcriptional regulator